VGQLADGGGLARAVDAYHQHHGRRLGDVRHGPFARLQNLEQMLADEISQLAGVAHQAAVHALLDPVQNFLGGLDADVGADERELQLVEQVGVDGLTAGECFLQARDQAGARLLDALLELFE
jgi:hypothetical protein